MSNHVDNMDTDSFVGNPSPSSPSQQAASHYVAQDDTDYYVTTSSTGARSQPGFFSEENRRHRVLVLAALVVSLIGIAVVAFVVVLMTQENRNGGGNDNNSIIAPCTSQVYCQGPLLKMVQDRWLFDDCKTFVDMPIKAKSVEEVLQKFHALGPNPTQIDLVNFVNANFDDPGSEIKEVVPVDFVEDPAFLSTISQPDFKTFGLSIHQKWKNLVRRYDLSNFCGPECVSSLPLNHTFVVPGGRFREFYYWDTFWILHGLLVSGLHQTAKDTLLNMLQLVEMYGFIPNGARKYYLDRSQPPLLVQMVSLYFNETQDAAMVKKALPFLKLEHDYWMRQHTVANTAENFPDVAETKRSEILLSHYNSITNQPRPESYREDIEHLKAAGNRTSLDIFSQLATGAETGWDYSSRWFKEGSDNITTIVASSIVPVDLNSILLRNEQILADWYQSETILGTDGVQDPSNQNLSQTFATFANRREQSLFDLLWYDDNATFCDYRLDTHQIRKEWYGSNLVAFWVPSVSAKISSIMSGGRSRAAASQTLSLFLDIGGFPTSLLATGQQWDFPNAWPPMQWFAERAFVALGDTARAHTIVQRWVDSGYCGWLSTIVATKNGQKVNATHLMFEKYSAVDPGAAGHGGEYTVQEGFGWTNGVMLRFLTEYGNDLVVPSSCRW